VVALTLLVPQVGELLARPLQALTRRGSGDLGGGFFLGASLGLVFVPCAGPVLAAVTVIAAKRDVGFDGVLLTLSYAIGAALPMLAIAFAGQRAAKAFRTRAEWIRRGAGVLVAAAAIAIALGVDQELQTAIPGYTASLQEHVERSSAAKRELGELTGARTPKATGNSASTLKDYGPAPEFRGVAGWLNSKPLTLKGLRGRVVLIDFWTYSCINCLRTLPYLKAWDARYRSKGLVILGVHTPEFAFEHDLGNVRAAVKRLGVRYPVALDNSYGTWKAYSNNYWPADYLVDQAGRVRDVHFGEGDYAKTERNIRLLLEAGQAGRLPQAGRDTDRTPLEIRTPESYLGYLRIGNYTGSPLRTDRPAAYRFPASLTQDSYAYAGTWKVEGERIVADDDARLRLNFTARTVHLVLTGRGLVTVKLNGKPQATVRVNGDRLYTLVTQKQAADGLLELGFTPGLAAYAFTFG
jgi:thiol-disulfide isomerase/thioredoxin